MKMNVRWSEIYDKLCGLVSIIIAICLLGFVFVYSALEIFDNFYGIDRMHHKLMERKHPVSREDIYSALKFEEPDSARNSLALKKLSFAEDKYEIVASILDYYYENQDYDGYMRVDSLLSEVWDWDRNVWSSGYINGYKQRDSLIAQSLWNAIIYVEKHNPGPVSDSVAAIILDLSERMYGPTLAAYDIRTDGWFLAADRKARYAWQLHSPNADRYTDILISLGTRSKGLFSPSRLIFWDRGGDIPDYYEKFFSDPLYIRYKQLIQKRKYKKARQILDLLSSKTTDIEYNPNNPYSFLQDTVISPKFPSYDTSAWILEYAKYDLASISENARLRCIQKEPGYEDWMNGAYLTGVRYLDPLEKILEGAQPNTHSEKFNDLVPYIIINYNNPDARWVYNTALFVKGNSSASYLDIRDRLLPNECVVEIVRAPSLDFGADKYFAILLRNGWNEPKLIGLPDSGQMSSILLYNNIYASADSEVYKHIWKPIEKHLVPGDVVYYSPDGLMNLMNISAISDGEGMSVSEKYHLRQCVSTANVDNRDFYSDNQTVVLFGGLDYGDGFFKPLSSAVDEIKEIATLAEDYGRTVDVNSGLNGSERAFRSLSGSLSSSILHIATHGFYFTATNVPQVTWFDKMDYKDNPLQRCGLILSGGNTAWNAVAKYDEIDDGILTGAEIAKLDLSSFNLVVLSACYTGLGDIAPDGIAGLIKAFRNAGVRHLIVTLDKVDDKATSLFMKSFYEQLLCGVEMHTAFDDAVRFIKSTPEYCAARFWAPFILLDL